MKAQRGSTISLTSALDGGGWLTPCLGRLTPSNVTVTRCIGDCVGPRASLDGCGKFRPLEDSIPGSPTLSELRSTLSSTSALEGVGG